MTTFDEREKNFERQFQHDQELLFRIQNRRNRLFGLWAAELQGLNAEAAAAYAAEVVASDIERRGGKGVFEKVCNDLKARNVDLSDHRVQRKFEGLLQVAHEQIMTETNGSR
jgi:hypothetical protein